MKNLCFHYHMEIKFEKMVSKHRFTLKCIPQNGDYQEISNLSYDVFPNDFMNLSNDSFSNNTLIGFIPNEHKKFYVDVTGMALVGGNKAKTKYNKHEVAFYKYPTKITSFGETLKEYFSAFTFSCSMSNLEKSVLMMKKLYTDFEYQKEVTSLSTTAEEAMSIGKGVCQDYAQILIALCNKANIPARYVAGLLVGEGYSHAWVEIFEEDKDGKGVWIALDPTNNLIVDDMHIKISCGRDYSDCLINQGVFYGGGKQIQKISVIVYECNK
ncbi:MAG: transglutaminase family protein [Clostridia bacterium]